MKNRGFTLIELLGVIIILAILVTIIFPSIINSVKGSGEKTDQLMLDMIYNAADLYVTDNPNEYMKVEGNKYTVLLSDLVAEDLLASPIKLSNSDEDITNLKCVQADYSNGDFSYELKNNGECVFTGKIYRNTNEIIKTGDSIATNLTSYETEKTKGNITTNNYLRHDVENNIVVASYVCIKYIENEKTKETCLKNEYGTYDGISGTTIYDVSELNPTKSIEIMSNMRDYFIGNSGSCSFNSSRTICGDSSLELKAYSDNFVYSTDKASGLTCKVATNGYSLSGSYGSSNCYE